MAACREWGQGPGEVLEENPLECKGILSFVGWGIGMAVAYVTTYSRLKMARSC